MRGRLLDLTGLTVGKLTVLRQSGWTKWGRSVWLCHCECGKEKEISSGSLVQMIVGSCGCVSKIPRGQGYNFKSYKHGRIYTSEYCSWGAMKTRCLNNKSKDYPNYGGRGVIICDSWMSFENFFADMGPRPQGTELDRKDPNGNYEPENCRWFPVGKGARRDRPRKRIRLTD